MQYEGPLGLITDPGNPKLITKIQDLEQYDFRDITRDVAEKYQWDADKATKMELEFKRFLSLAWLDPGEYHIPEADVDEYWHRAILHTRWYAQFCSDTFNDFYHHTPEPSAENLNERNRERSRKLVKYWYGQEWVHLVRTCTQCRGPYVALDNTELAPMSAAMPNI